jgi:hypothetical protein
MLAERRRCVAFLRSDIISFLLCANVAPEAMVFEITQAASARTLAQCLIQIRDKVVRILDPD